MRSDLRTDYLGLQLNSPVVVGACGLTTEPAKVRELSLAGAGAIVLPPLFEEQIAREVGSETQKGGRERSFGDADHDSLSSYLTLIARLKTITAAPIIASLNGASEGSWLRVTDDLERVGAEAIELCLDSAIASPEENACEIEARLVSAIKTVCDTSTVPVSVKLSPYHTNLSNLAWSIVGAGAHGVTCFAQDTAWRVSIDAIESSLSWNEPPAGYADQTLSGIVRTYASRAPLSLAACGGVCSTEDAIRAFLAGADCVMLVSELYRSGPDAITHILEGLSVFLERNHFVSLAELFAKRPASKCHRVQTMDGFENCKQ